MANNQPKIERESQTIAVMVRIYCRSRHGGQELCPACRGLLDYARNRLEKCPFQETKPTCAKCPVHCYQPEMRTKVREVMRFSGPRMFYRHPVIAIRHLLEGRRRVEIKR